MAMRTFLKTPDSTAANKRGDEMKTMPDKIALGTKAVTYTGFFYWLGDLLNSYTPQQWTAIGVIGTLIISILGWLTTVGFGVWDRISKAKREAQNDVH